MTTNLTKIIDGLVVVLLNINLWQGRKKLRSEDLAEKGIEASSLPPEKLASLGSKRVVSPDAVNVFMALKRRAERACLAVGTRFLGGYAIPEDRMPALQAELDAIAIEFGKEKSHFLSQYETTVNAWADENPEWRDAIMRAVDPTSYVSSQLQCNYTALRVQPAKGAEGTLDNQVNGLQGQLKKEVAQAAKTAWEESYQGKLNVRGSALSKLDSINEKLAGLAFLDSSIALLQQSVSQVLTQCKGKQTIEGSDLMAVCGILATLMGLDRIRFSSEVDAASAAATMFSMPDMEPPAESPQPEQATSVQEEPVAAAPQPKPTRTRRSKKGPAVGVQPELAMPEPVISIPVEEEHFTEMFVPENTKPQFTKPVVRVNDEVWEGEDLPFGVGEAEPAIVADPSQKVTVIPTEWW